MIHQYKSHGYNIVMDVNSSAVHVVDDVVYDMIPVYEKQEDKEAIFDAVDTVKLCLETFIPMIATMTVRKDNMRAAAAKGFINATDCADYLVKKGMPFRDAYKISGTLVAKLCRLKPIRK